MINPHELRLGNILADQSGRECTVTRIRQEDVQVRYVHDGKVKYSYVDCEYLEPIPLTEEWLLKLGFEYREEVNAYTNKHHLIAINPWELVFHPYCTNDDDCWVSMQYVHQLQNIHFALCGKELEVKK